MNFFSPYTIKAFHFILIRKGVQKMNILQQLEQIQAMLRDLSPVLWSYKKNLKKQGFTENQAFRLTLEYQRILFDKGKGN